MQILRTERLTLGLRPAAAHHSKVFAEISSILGEEKETETLGMRDRARE